jgi:hypothetical protein
LPEEKVVAIQMGLPGVSGAMIRKKKEQLAPRRTSITRADLELTIADAVRRCDPHCRPLVGIIVERVVPASAGGANWAVQGVKYGKADRERCCTAMSIVVKEGMREFEISD